MVNQLEYIQSKFDEILDDTLRRKPGLRKIVRMALGHHLPKRLRGK